MATTTVPSITLAHCCGLCNTVMGKSTTEAENNNPFLVTKCGHIFHFECINKFYSRSADNAAWGPKACPSCKISLTVATDVFRIFPTNIVETKSDEPQTTKEELVTQVNGLKKQVMELSNRLELSFLKRRECEQIVVKYRTEMESLDARLGAEIKQIVETNSYIDWLKSENHHLKNTVSSLTTSLIECQQRLQLPPRPFLPLGTNQMPPNFLPMINNQGPRRNFPPPFFSPFGNPHPGLLGPGYFYPNGMQCSRPPIPSTINGTRRTGDERVGGRNDNSTSMNDDSQFLIARLSEVNLNPIETDKDSNETGSGSLEDMKSENVSSEENGGSMMADPTDEAKENKIINNSGHEYRAILKDMNGNRLENDVFVIGNGQPIHWKYEYHCKKCDVSWENRGGQNPPTSFCHGCHKIVAPHSQEPIEN